MSTYPTNVNWPSNYEGCTVTGKYVDTLGNPVVGTVDFKPSPTALLDAAADTIVVSKPVTVTLDENGEFEVVIPATDDPDVNPTGFTYTVIENFKGGRTYSIDAPKGTTIDLSDVAPVPSALGVAIVRGEPGLEGQQGVAGPQGPAGPAGPVGPPVPVDALERMATALDYKQNLTFAIASDSTSNDPGDWPSVWLYKMAQKYPDLKVVRRGWNDATQAYNADTVIQAGTPSPDLGGITMNDAFSRTGEVVGSVSNSGHTWGGTTGVFTMDGNYAINSLAKLGTLSVNNQQKNATVTADLSLITTGTGAAQQLRIYAASDSAFGNSHVFLFVSLTTAGVMTAGVYKRVSGAVTWNQTFTTTQITNTGIVAGSATPQTFQMKLQVDIQNVTATLTGPSGVPQTITHTMSESDYAVMGNYAGLGNAAATASPGMRVDNFKVDTPFQAGTAWTLTGVISAMGGGTLEYQRTRIATMYPSRTPIDVMIIAHGHNYSNQTGATLTGLYDAFIAEYGSAHPESAYLISSQNAEQPPFSYRGFHAIRNAAVRAWAKFKRYAYLPAFEEFAKQSDGGASYVLSDGVHPTTTAVGTTTGAYGSVLWANVLDREVVARQWVK